MQVGMFHAGAGAAHGERLADASECAARVALRRRQRQPHGALAAAPLQLRSRPQQVLQSLQNCPPRIKTPDWNAASCSTMQRCCRFGFGTVPGR